MQQWRVALVSLLALLLGAAAQSPTDNGLNHPNLQLLPLDTCGVNEARKEFFSYITEINEYPWTALLRYKIQGNGDSETLQFRCVGTLISRRYVVSAAHCMSRSVFKLVSVRLGEWEIEKDEDCSQTGLENTSCSDPPLDLGVEEIILHPDYNRRGSNDIALIRLSNLAPEKSKFIKPICLPIGDETNRVYPPGEKMILSGWTLGGDYENRTIKKKEVVTVVDHPQCQETYKLRFKRIISNTQLCVRNNYASCTLQGPLMYEEVERVRMVFVGFVSFGRSICDTDTPDVYTRVSSYITWILDNIRP